MAKAERTETYDVDRETFYETLIKYEDYPEFVEGCSAIKVLEKSEESALVEYSLNIIKNFTYQLRMTQNRPNRLEWEFASGDLFKKNQGYWELEDMGDGHTKVNYYVEVDFKALVPGMIVKKLVNHNLPSMLQAYYERAKNGG